MSDGNGAWEPRTIKVDMLILKYDRATDHLDLGVECESVDLALDMLGRATRALEAQLRKQHALEVAAAIDQQRRDAALAAQVRGGR